MYSVIYRIVRNVYVEQCSVDIISAYAQVRPHSLRLLVNHGVRARFPLFYGHKFAPFLCCITRICGSQAFVHFVLVQSACECIRVRVHYVYVGIFAEVRCSHTQHFAVVMFAYKICCPSGYSSTTIRPLACSRYCCARAERTSTRFVCCTHISTVQVLFSSRTRCKN